MDYKQYRYRSTGVIVLMGFLLLMLGLGAGWIVWTALDHPAYWTSIIRITSIVILGLIWLTAATIFLGVVANWYRNERTGGPTEWS